MNKVFANQIGNMLEVYMDDMIVKFKEDQENTSHKDSLFGEVRKYGIHLYLGKCIFRVRYGKFIRDYLIEKGIKVSHVQCRAMINMRTPNTKKGIQKLNGIFFPIPIYL